MPLHYQGQNHETLETMENYQAVEDVFFRFIQGCALCLGNVYCQYEVGSPTSISMDDGFQCSHAASDTCLGVDTTYGDSPGILER